MSSVTALIPMRSGSKGLPGKNITLVNGKPLCVYTIETAQQSKIFSEILCITDGPEIAKVCEQAGAKTLILPSKYTQDDSPVIHSIKYTVDSLKQSNKLPDTFFLLEATSYRLPIHITEAWELMQSKKVKSVVSVIPIPAHHHPDWSLTISPEKHVTLFSGESLTAITPRRQELKPAYTRNGAIYAFSSPLVTQKNPTIYSDDCLAYLMPEEFCIDIDTAEDLEKFKTLLNQKTHVRVAT